MVDYAVWFFHLEWHCPHIFSKEKERARKFILGLDEGLRPWVISNNPQTLLHAIEMTTWLEEDHQRSEAIFRKQRGLAPIPYKFKIPSKVSRGNDNPLQDQCPSKYPFQVNAHGVTNIMGKENVLGDRLHAIIVVRLAILGMIVGIGEKEFKVQWQRALLQPYIHSTKTSISTAWGHTWTSIIGTSKW